MDIRTDAGRMDAGRMAAERVVFYVKLFLDRLYCVSFTSQKNIEMCYKQTIPQK